MTTYYHQCSAIKAEQGGDLSLGWWLNQDSPDLFRVVFCPYCGELLPTEERRVVAECDPGHYAGGGGMFLNVGSEGVAPEEPF